MSNPSYALAIHTSSPDLGLALSNFSGDERSQVWDLGRDLSTQLHLYLAEFLHPQRWSDLTFLAVTKGPGGFTGTRLGVVTARTLAQQLDIPLFAVSTLEAIAWSTLPSLDNATHVAVQMRAQRGELFVGIYQRSGDQAGLTPQLPDAVMSPERWQQTLETKTSPYHLVTAEGNLGNSVKSLLELADHQWQQGKRPHWSEALPFYGQHPVEMLS